MSGRDDVLRGLGEVAPDWRIEDFDGRRVQVRNRDGYIADVIVDTNPETSARNRNTAKLIARAPALVDEVRELREALRPFAAFACGSEDGSGVPEDGCTCHNCNAALLLPEPPEADPDER